ncbi:hypothetical protein [Sphingomonas sp. 3-13AW]|uniref:hypothetical protein n=1 Tax=Sphingomonas sp. 3-13AW TaxID=3050450 RepID=UPI003BB7287B
MIIAQGFALAFLAIFAGLFLMTRGSVLIEAGGMRTLAGVPLVVAGLVAVSIGLMLSTGSSMRIGAIVLPPSLWLWRF